MQGTFQENPSGNVVPRVFAVLGLVAAGILVIVLIAGSLGGSSSTSSPSPATTAAPKTPQKPYYVVKPGDSLSSIAAKVGVSQARLEHLNQSRLPDPQSLQPQNCIDVQPDGCKRLAAKLGG